ncbi:hypothetical protein OOT46_15305 [Aquabacterium sp. A7-Y]|uniref:hypothetical protein n=1 Tax=Aquabacterium sp. A7-Y TaxID=1349605 RepID=UPI00223E5102|nr:hypothetical protein [Aquabacterium sp. A7-Y]MCW7539210.1 hypothetical protein [Aquabacterium sp. A7-Y]
MSSPSLRYPQPQDVTDAIPRMLRGGDADPIQDWVTLCDACSRSAVDTVERSTAAWMETQSLMWLGPMQWLWPTLPLVPGRDDPVQDDANKLMAGTVPPQPFQEAARELLAIGWRGVGDWRQWWAPWTHWSNALSSSRLH